MKNISLILVLLLLPKFLFSAERHPSQESHATSTSTPSSFRINEKFLRFFMGKDFRGLSSLERRNGVLVIGHMRVGKSALINYLCGVPMKENSSGLHMNDPRWPKGSYARMSPKVMTAETTIPEAFHPFPDPANENHNLVFCDIPAIDEKGLFSMGLQLTVNKLKNIRAVIVVLGVNDLIDSQKFELTLETLSSLFPHNFEELSKNLFFVINPVYNSAYKRLPRFHSKIAEHRATFEKTVQKAKNEEENLSAEPGKTLQEEAVKAQNSLRILRHMFQSFGTGNERRVFIWHGYYNLDLKRELLDILTNHVIYTTYSIEPTTRAPYSPHLIPKASLNLRSRQSEISQMAENFLLYCQYLISVLEENPPKKSELDPIMEKLCFLSDSMEWKTKSTLEAVFKAYRRAYESSYEYDASKLKRSVFIPPPSLDVIHLHPSTKESIKNGTLYDGIFSVTENGDSIEIKALYSEARYSLRSRSIKRASERTINNFYIQAKDLYEDIIYFLNDSSQQDFTPSIQVEKEKSHILNISLRLTQSDPEKRKALLEQIKRNYTLEGDALTAEEVTRSLENAKKRTNEALSKTGEAFDDEDLEGFACHAQ